MLKELQKDKLKVFVYDGRPEMGKAAAVDAAERIRKIIGRKGFATAVFAAAPSQNEFLEELCKQDLDWSKVDAFHMDEYVGLDLNAPQRFGNFLKEAIFKKLSFRSVHYIQQQGVDPEASVREYEKLLTKNPPDLVFLGIGENGHLAFNDPGTADFKDPRKVKIVTLDHTCRNQQVNDGCFKTIDDVPKTAITLTMSMLLSIPETVAIVPGSTKMEAVYKTVNDPVSTLCPATALRVHQGAALYVDRDAGRKLL